VFRHEFLQLGEDLIARRQLGHERAEGSSPMPARLLFELRGEEVREGSVSHAPVCALLSQQLVEVDRPQKRTEIPQDPSQVVVVARPRTMPPARGEPLLGLEQSAHFLRDDHS
jgi:hypothetical protein